MVDVIFRDVDLEKLPQIAALLAPAKPELLKQPAPAWTADDAEALLRDLPDNAFNLMRELVLHRGRVDADLLRGDGTLTLRGLTGPITKAMARLTKSGGLAEGLKPPVQTQYDPNIRAYQKAIAFVMPNGIAAAFIAALARIEPEATHHHEPYPTS